MSQSRKPWLEPGYKGKLKETIRLPCQPGFKMPDIDGREILYTALADGDMDIDLFNNWIILYNKNNPH